MAAPTVAIVVVKSFAYRLNAAEEWSNKYMLTGTTPADAAAWRALFDALVVEERKCYGPAVSVIKGYAYDSVADDATSVWSVDLRVSPNTPQAGSFSITTQIPGGGDSAGWIRWGLNRMVSGKRVYLRKYFHPALMNATGGDALNGTWKTALQTFATKMSDGTFTGSRVVTDKLGSSILNTGVAQYATTRTLKRRGKRPPT